MLERIFLSEKGKIREYYRNEIVEIREKRINKINDEIRKILNEVVTKYLFLRKKKVSNRDLEINMKEDQKVFMKEHSLKSLIDMLKSVNK